MGHDGKNASVCGSGTAALSGGLDRRTFLRGLVAAGLAAEFGGMLPDRSPKAEAASGGLLDGVIDLHIHPGPDVVRRKYNDIELAQDARAQGAKAVVLKSHVLPTVARATIASYVVPDLKIFGGIVLNPQVGGFNIEAVQTALTMGAKIIWLPTAWASNERKQVGKAGGIESVVDGEVAAPLVQILRLIAKYDVALGTGHLSSREIITVVDKAAAIGVKKIIINHPEYKFIDMPFEDQKLLASYGVYFERCFARSRDDGSWERNFARNYKAIEALGHENTILATDGGQTVNPRWSEAWSEYLNNFLAAGVPQQNLDIMAKVNPARMLDLE